MRRLRSTLLLLGLVTACTPTPASPSPDRLATVVAGTLTAVPIEPATAIPTFTRAATQALFSPFFVLTSAQNVNLRTRPGLLFPVSRVMPEETRLQVLGRSPGGDWLSVLTDESVPGWVQINLVAYGHDGPPPPVIEPTDVMLVRGRVTDASGQPVSGIGFAVTRGSGASAQRTDAITNESGTFYAYLPPSVAGLWTVEFNSIACTSSLMDAACNCRSGACGAAQPASVQVSLPLDRELEFVWE
jgi:hypothetical protein